MKTLYFIPQGSCYLEIVKIRYHGPNYIVANVIWYSRPGMTLLCVEKSLKILHKVKQNWIKVGVDSNGKVTEPDIEEVLQEV